MVFELEAITNLFYLSEENVWIHQVTMLPGLTAGLTLYLLILKFMWKKGLDEPIDKLYFFDFTTLALFTLGQLLANRFYLYVDHNDPGELFCIFHRLFINGIASGMTHKIVGTMMAIARWKFVCDPDTIHSLFV